MATRLHASIVASSVDPRLTFLQFVDRAALPRRFLDDVNRYKFRGSSGKVNLALDALPDFTCLPGPGAHLRGAISISPSIDYMERAYDAAKYGRFSPRPYIDIVIPSLTDPSVAPPGKHVMSCFVQYAPYHLQEGSWDEQRRGVRRHRRRIRSRSTRRTCATSSSIVRSSRRSTSSASGALSEGNIFQGELTLEQLFFLRPAPGWAQYTTPIKNLYMCGSATHPGGGIMGAPGRNAALQDSGRHSPDLTSSSSAPGTMG